MEHDQTQPIILIASLWETRPWYPRFLKLLAAVHLLLPKSQSFLSIPKIKMLPPMWKGLELITWHLPGKAYLTTTFENVENLIIYSWRTPTQAKYKLAQEKWHYLCPEESIKPFAPYATFL